MTEGMAEELPPLVSDAFSRSRADCRGSCIACSPQGCLVPTAAIIDTALSAAVHHVLLRLTI